MPPDKPDVSADRQRDAAAGQDAPKPTPPVKAGELAAARQFFASSQAGTDRTIPLAHVESGTAQDRHLDVTGRPLSEGNEARVAEQFKPLTPAELRASRAELERDMSQYNGSPGTNVLDQLRNSGLSKPQQETILNSLAEVRERHLSQRDRNGQIVPEQKGGYVHAIGELSEVLEGAKDNHLTGKETTKAALAAMFSDSSKAGWNKGSGGNFFTHHLDGALAAGTALDRYRKDHPESELNAQDVKDIQRIILEHQIAPPQFMAGAYTGEISARINIERDARFDQLASHNAGSLSSSEQEQLQRLGMLQKSFPLTPEYQATMERLTAQKAHLADMSAQGKSPLSPEEQAELAGLKKLSEDYSARKDDLAELDELKKTTQLTPEQTAKFNQLQDQQRYGAWVSEAEAANLKSIQGMIAKPFQSPTEPDEHGGRRLAFTPDQRELLKKYLGAGTENWYVPEEIPGKITERSSEVAREGAVMLQADNDNYFARADEQGHPIKAPNKIAALRGLTTINADSNLDSAIASIKQSAESSFQEGLVTPGSIVKFGNRVEDSERVYDVAKDSVARWLHERLGPMKQEYDQRGHDLDSLQQLQLKGQLNPDQQVRLTALEKQQKAYSFLENYDPKSYDPNNPKADPKLGLDGIPYWKQKIDGIVSPFAAPQQREAYLARPDVQLGIEIHHQFVTSLEKMRRVDGTVQTDFRPVRGEDPAELAARTSAAESSLLGKSAVTESDVDPANIKGLRTDAATDSIDRLQQQLVDSLNPSATDARKISQDVVDGIKTSFGTAAPGPDGYQSIAQDLEAAAQTESDGQKAAAMKGAATILRRAGRELNDQETAAAEAVRASGDVRQAGLGAGGEPGLESVTARSVQARMETRLADRASSGLLANDAKDPKVLRDALHITDEDLKRLEPRERAGLADELRGKLMAYGIAADLVPDLVSQVFHIAL